MKCHKLGWSALVLWLNYVQLCWKYRADRRWRKIVQRTQDQEAEQCSCLFCCPICSSHCSKHLTLAGYVVVDSINCFEEAKQALILLAATAVLWGFLPSSNHIMQRDNCHVITCKARSASRICIETTSWGGFANVHWNAHRRQCASEYECLNPDRMCIKCTLRL